MRSWRRTQPQGPSTASRLSATAPRILISVRKKKVVKGVMINHICEEGQILAPQPWKRYQNTPVTWNGPSSRRTQPVSGACGGLSGPGGLGGPDAPSGCTAAPGRDRPPRGAAATETVLIAPSVAPPAAPPAAPWHA